MLASLGRLEGFTAVVIGAMLVAPLLAAGFAVAQGNLQLFGDAPGVSGLGIDSGLSASLIIGLINPGFEPSMEIEARGDPDVLDLLIALASGTAGNVPGLYGGLPCRDAVP